METKRKSVTEELHEDHDLPYEALEKLKHSRNNYAVWVTKCLNHITKHLESPHLSILMICRDRLIGQMKKLQSSHNAYILALKDDRIINEAEEWFENYFETTNTKLQQLETVVSDLQPFPM